MSENNRNCSNEAMEKIIGNMTAEMKNIDGQYVPLGFSAPTTTTETLNWNQQANYINHFHPDPMVGMEQYPGQQQSFGYMPQSSHMYENDYKKSFSDYEMYKTMQNGVPDMGLYDRDYRLLLPNRQIIQNHMQQETMPQSSNRTQLIESLVGNWMVPNNSGTYSPFGNAETFKPNVFDIQPERDNLHLLKEDTKFKPMEDDQFQFNRDLRKPRMVAEVKPMRPSYSDVLTKPVPQTNSVKPTKNDSKDAKPKKETKKSGKTDKEKKVNSVLNRSNTNNDIKEIPLDKNMNSTKPDKCKGSKTSNLSRKWASLDNITDNIQKVEETKKKKPEENTNKIPKPQTSKKINKTVSDIVDLELDANKCENSNTAKNGVKKITKPIIRPKSNDSFGNSERPPGKRNQRTRKKENHVPFGIFGQKLKQYTKGWWKIFTAFLFWLLHLISDICSLSLHISRDMAVNSWSWLCLQWSLFMDSASSVIQKIRIFSWLRDKFKGRTKADPSTDDNPNFVHNGLQHNITMPTTGEEAMKRLLACKGKDPYSILGVTPTCTDDDIKRYYKRQAFLVHPDKNNQPGAEEAFKILVHAFDMIGEPERRASYDRGVVESAQVVQAWTELTQLLNQLQQKVEAAANTIRCSACGLRHKRVKVDRPSYAARNCNMCKIHHAAREGDIWAEAKVFGFLWHYYACMEGAVYDITEWAGCQKDSLKHLRPDAHHVQYRIALGKQNNQPKRHMQPPSTDRPDLENLLNSLYGQSENSGQGPRRRHKKGNK